MNSGMRIKEERKKYGDSQQKLGEALGVSREAISAIEQGRNKLSPDLSSETIKRYNSPLLAMDIAFNYTNSLGIHLNGRNVDMHRMTSTRKTIEELKEILAAAEISEKAMVKPVGAIQHYERDDVVRLVQEMFDGITALTNCAAAIVIEYGMNWDDEWQKHIVKLRSKEFIN